MWYSVGQFAKLVGVTDQTIRNWDKSGILKPARRLVSGKRLYSDEELKKAFTIPDEEKKS
jgi:putative resolvase